MCRGIRWRSLLCQITHAEAAGTQRTGEWEAWESWEEWEEWEESGGLAPVGKGLVAIGFRRTLSKGIWRRADGICDTSDAASCFRLQLLRFL